MKAERARLLAEARAALAQSADAHAGERMARALSDGTAHMLTQIALPARVALVAQGGLARRELAPESDVDLCLLVDDDAPAAVEEEAARALTPMWDAGFRLALAVRRERDVPELFADVTGKAGHAATALIEARFVSGDESLARRVLRRARREQFPARRDDLIAEKRAELHQRRAKFGASPFHNEPDLKSGAGGLRDLHTLAWIGLLYAGEGAIDVEGDWLRGLLAVGRLSESEARVLREARSTLLRLRAALHLAVGRADDRLHADNATRTAHVLAGAPLLAGQGAPPAEPRGVRASTDVVREAVLAMGDVFRVAEDVHARWDKRPRPPFALASLDELRELAGSTLPEARRDLDVREHEPFARALLNGDLARVVPDIARLRAHVKHDGVHQLTTDAHLCSCADKALAVASRTRAIPAPLADSLARTTATRVFVLAAFLHDIGKGLPGDHSLVGAAIARALGAQLRLDVDEIDTLVFLVEEHLLLSRTAQRRDLSDPAVIAELVDKVRTPERLDLLALLTWVDMDAVAPGTATEWKAQLLATAVERTRAALADPAAVRLVDDAMRARAKRVLAAEPAAHERSALIDAFVDGASVRFLGARGDDDLAFDLDAYARFAGGAVPNVELRSAGAVHELRVVTRDRPGLLADIAGALAGEGANILDAMLDVRADGTAFDVFVVDNGRGASLAHDTAARLVSAVANAPTGGAVQRRGRGSARVTPRVRVLPSDSWGRAVLEVRAADRTGLLAELAHAMAKHGLSIALARIHTEGPRVTDVFTVERATDRAAPSPDELERARAALLEVAAP